MQKQKLEKTEATLERNSFNGLTCNDNSSRQEFYSNVTEIIKDYREFFKLFLKHCMLYFYLNYEIISSFAI